MSNMDITQSITLGVNESVREDIEKLYELREGEYTEFLEKMGGKGHLSYVDAFDAAYKERIRKAYAIVQIAYIEQESERLVPLMKKAYPSLYEAFAEDKTFNFRDVLEVVSQAEKATGTVNIDVLAAYTALLYFNSFYTPSKIETHALQEMHVFIKTYVQDIQTTA